MLKTSNSHKLLSSISSGEPDIIDVIDFVLHIVYNRPLKEKTPWEASYNMMMKKKQTKDRKKKYSTTKDLPLDQSSLKMKILRASFAGHCMDNCLDKNYVPLDASLYAWKFFENRWEPIWYTGSPLPNPGEISDESDDGEESDDAEDTEIAGEPGYDSESSEYATSDSDNDCGDSDDDFEF